MLAAAAGCLVVGGWWLRAIAALAGMLIVPGLLAGLTHLAMPAVGHLMSLAFGAAFAGGYLAGAGPARIAPHPVGYNDSGGLVQVARLRVRRGGGNDPSSLTGRSAGLSR